MIMISNTFCMCVIQGSVERGNGILERKLGALMEQNQSIEWVIALKLTLWAKNNTI